MLEQETELTMSILANKRERNGGVLSRSVSISPFGLQGILRKPHDAKGIVIFAHGTGSSRMSPRNVFVADSLNDAGFATLLFDLLSPGEECDRRNVFDVGLLGERLEAAIDLMAAKSETAGLPIGLFGASTGAAAALIAAAHRGGLVQAVVSRGGRPDLAEDALAQVSVPVCLIVGGNDPDVLALNRSALARLAGPTELKIIPGATHLFPEGGALDAVVAEAVGWFGHHLVQRKD